MRWKQFLTPVDSINPEDARKLMNEKLPDEYTLLDVRQPNEYEAGHISGAKLIPLPELTNRLDEIDPGKPVVVY